MIVMKKVLSVLLCLLMVFGSFAGAITTASAEEVNLWTDMTVEDFGTKDTVNCPISGYEEYQNTYGKAFRVKTCYYTSFYITMPELEPNTEYSLSFKYDNHVISGNAGSIRSVHVATEEDVAKVDQDGTSMPSTATLIGSSLELDKGAYTTLTATFKTGDTATTHYLYFITNYAYWLYLCDFKLAKVPNYNVTVAGGTADKPTAKPDDTVTITATPTATQTFAGWEVVSGEVTIADEFAATTTFTMPAENVSIKANYVENLWANIDTTWFGSKDTTPNGSFGFSEYNNDTYDDAIAVNRCWHTTFYIKLPSDLEPNTDYELSFCYDNSIQTTASKITRIDVVTEEAMASANADGYNVAPFKNLSNTLSLDQGGWTEFTAEFKTGADPTQYYLYFLNGYCFTLRLANFNFKKIVKNPINVENGTADPTSAKKGATVTITANQPADGMIFDKWQVVSGDAVISDPYSAATTLTMGSEAAKITAVYKEYGAKIAYVKPDGTPYTDSENLNDTKTVITENGDGTNTVTVTYDSMEGINQFLGWYKDGTLLEKGVNYTYDPAEIDISTVTAKLLCRNVLSGAAGFESYANETNMRVDPAATGVAPYDDKWGLSSGSYETENIGFYIRTSGERNTTYFTDVGYNRETGTYYAQNAMKTAKYLATPHSGDSMLEVSACYRAFVRKLDGLKANTEYTLSFYVLNPDEYNFLTSAAVLDTHLEKNSYLNVMSNRYVEKIAGEKLRGFYEEPRVEPLWETNVTMKDTASVRNWKKISFTFNTGDNPDSMYLYLTTRTRNQWWNRCAIYLDDLVCYENLLPNAGNAIRATSATLPQALRYKFKIDNDLLTSYEGYTFKKLGLLATTTANLAGEPLVVGGKYNGTGVEKVAQDVPVNENNYQYRDGDTENTYFTAALYNIGVTDGEVDYAKYDTLYSVRPYSVYTNTDGAEITIYGETVHVSLFDVIYAIRDAALSQSDLEVANGIIDLPAARTAYSAWQPEDGWNIDNPNAPTEYDYSFAVIGDIQYTTESYPEDLHYTFDWLINNKTDKKLQYVFNMGDITNGSKDIEYQNIDAQLMRLKDAGINQTVVRGNHDKIAPFDKYITTQKYAYGGQFESYDGTMKTCYNIVTVCGIKYMMLSLDFFPCTAEVEWAAKKIADNPDCNVIITTHGYLDGNMTLLQEKEVYDVDDRKDADGNALGGHAGQYIYDNLVVPYSNVVMVLCGHECSYGPEYNILTREDGSTAVQILTDYQQEEYTDLRAYGMISMFYFSNGGKTVTVEWFSSIKNEYYMDKYQYTVDVTIVK